MYKSNAGPEFANVQNSCLNGRCPVAALTPPDRPVIPYELVRDARHSVTIIEMILNKDILEVLTTQRMDWFYG